MNTLLEKMPVTYRENFAPAVNKLVRELRRDYVEDVACNFHHVLVDAICEEADMRFGIPSGESRAAKMKRERIERWRTLVAHDVVARLNDEVGSG